MAHSSRSLPRPRPAPDGEIPAARPGPDAARGRRVITYRVDFSRTDDHGHVLVRTAAAGDRVTMLDENGTRCHGTVVLHSPDLGLLLVRPIPGPCEAAVVADVEGSVPRRRHRHPRDDRGCPEAGCRRSDPADGRSRRHEGTPQDRGERVPVGAVGAGRAPPAAVDRRRERLHLVEALRAGEHGEVGAERRSDRGVGLGRGQDEIGREAAGEVDVVPGPAGGRRRRPYARGRRPRAACGPRTRRRIPPRRSPGRRLAVEQRAAAHGPAAATS